MSYDDDVDAMGEPVKGGLEARLTRAINRESEENVSNTPDFILGKCARAVLTAVGEAIRERDRWYGVKLEPGGAARQLPPAEAFIVVAEDSKMGVRAWIYSTQQGAEDAAWFWARHRVTNPETDVRVEANPNYLLLLYYPIDSEDGSAVWVARCTLDTPPSVQV